MFISEKMDTGPVLLTEEVPVGDNETIGELHDKLAATGAELLIKTIEQFDMLTPVPQDDSQATYCKKIKKEDRELDLNWDWQKIHNTVRAIGGFFMDEGKRVVVTRTIIKNPSLRGVIDEAISLKEIASPRSAARNDGMVTLSKYLDIYVRPEGKKEMPFADYLRGRTNNVS
jgi:methionyl-tRNA formyltransferase